MATRRKNVFPGEKDKGGRGRKGNRKNMGTFGGQTFAKRYAHLSPSARISSAQVQEEWEQGQEERGG